MYAYDIISAKASAYAQDVKNYKWTKDQVAILNKIQWLVLNMETVFEIVDAKGSFTREF